MACHSRVQQALRDIDQMHETRPAREDFAVVAGAHANMRDDRPVGDVARQVAARYGLLDRRMPIEATDLVVVSSIPGARRIIIPPDMGMMRREIIHHDLYPVTLVAREDIFSGLIVRTFSTVRVHERNGAKVQLSRASTSANGHTGPACNRINVTTAAAVCRCFTGALLR
jgi:hypothetical protein